MDRSDKGRLVWQAIVLLLLGYLAIHLTLVGLEHIELDKIKPLRELEVDRASAYLGLTLSPILVALIVLALGTATMGWGRIAFFGISCFLFSWFAEAGSMRWEWSGSYAYTDVLGGFTLPGEVPAIIPVTWFGMVFPTYIMANLALVGHPQPNKPSWRMVILLSVVAALIMTAWDLVADPCLVYRYDAWRWEPLPTDGHRYFGIPWKNYRDWVLVITGINLLWRAFDQRWSDLISYYPWLAWPTVDARARRSEVGHAARPMIGAKPRWKMVVAVTVVYLGALLADFPLGTPADSKVVGVFAMGIPCIIVAGAFFYNWRRAHGKSSESPAPALSPSYLRHYGPEKQELWPRAALSVTLGFVLVVGAVWANAYLDHIEPDFRVLVPIFAAGLAVHGAYLFGWRRAALFVALSIILGLGAELGGTHFGFPFGNYQYAVANGNTVIGAALPFTHVPWTIPLTWFVILYLGHIVANLVLYGDATARPRLPVAIAWKALLAAFLVTAWDLTLDPYMVQVSCAWRWLDCGDYLGIPFSNYAGWTGTAFLVYVTYHALEPRIPSGAVGYPYKTVVGVAVAVYAGLALGEMMLGWPVLTSGLVAEKRPEAHLLCVKDGFCQATTGLPDAPDHAAWVAAVFAMGLPAVIALIRLAGREGVGAGWGFRGLRFSLSAFRSRTRSP